MSVNVLIKTLFTNEKEQPICPSLSIQKRALKIALWHRNGKKEIEVFLSSPILFYIYNSFKTAYVLISQFFFYVKHP